MIDFDIAHPEIRMKVVGVGGSVLWRLAEEGRMLEVNHGYESRREIYLLLVRRQYDCYVKKYFEQQKRGAKFCISLLL